MPEQSEYLEILNELKEDALDIAKLLFNEEVLPLLKERQRIERTIGDKEIEEMLKLEKEAG